jgi:dTDP-4-amino-4,6-dideoxygalactose transaminase
MTQQSIPLVDLVRQHEQVADEVDAGLARLMATGAFTDGPDVGAFEAEFAAFSGARHAVGVASGTDALELALRAAGVEGGDEVIVPAHTFVATAEAALRIGAVPVFVDVDPDHLLIDPGGIAAAITPRTAAVVPVHLYGQLAPMGPIGEIATRHDLPVIADAAQAQGATGDGDGIATGVLAAGTSFYPGKNLGAYGDAGAVVTDDADVADVVRSMSHHGMGDDRYRHVRFGCTSRLDTLQAVVLRAKLARLEKWNDQRRAAAAYYDELLDGAEGVTRPATAPGNVHVWHLYVVQVDRRDEVLAELRGGGIGAGVHYPIPLPDQPVFAGKARPSGGERVSGAGDHPVARAAAGRILSLPLFPGITETQQERVVAALQGAVHRS